MGARSMIVTVACAVAMAAGLAASVEPAYGQGGARVGEIRAGKEQLPIKRITLYRSGVGSFERRGMVDGDAQIQLRFTTDQINDILKSMFVLDLSKGQGTIDGISYASKEPLSRRLGSFGIDISDNPSAGELLQRLRGTPVRLTFMSGETESGTVMNVETRPTIYPGTANAQTTKHDLPWCNLLTERGVRSVNLTNVTGFEILDPALAQELSKALAALAEYRADRTKTVEIKLRGQGARDVVVGYVQEMPVWKTSYRLVLPDLPAAQAGSGGASGGGENERPVSNALTVQGWAIVENTTDEDWNNVRLSLVSGRPVSFRMDLYEPLYTLRPLLPVPTIPGVLPRIFEGGDRFAEKDKVNLAEGAKMRFSTGRPRGEMKAGSPPPAAAPGDPRGAGGFAADEAAAPITGSDMGEYGAAAQAQGVSAGELFQFELQAPVTVERQKSAMLPILASGLDGRRVSIYSASDGTKNPMRGVELTNTSGLQLMPGPISVFDGSTYAGDAQIGHVPVGDKRLLAYSVDLEVDVTNSVSFVEDVRKVKFVNGLLEFTKQNVQTSTYTFVNKDQARGRTLIVEQARLPGWDLEQPAKAYEETQAVYRFDLKLPANQKGEFKVAQRRTEYVSYQFTDIGMDSLMEYSKRGAASKAVVDAFRDAGRRQAAINDTRRQIADLENERGTIAKDQDRIRNNMGGLDRTTKLYNDYVSTLTEQESRLKAINTQVSTLRGTLKNQEDDLRNYLASLNVE